MRKNLQLQFGRTMCLANAVILLLGIGSSCAAQTDTPDTAPASQVKIINAIGQDIAKLKAKFPQLREFSVSKNVLSQRLIIRYEYHTHIYQIGGSSRSLAVAMMLSQATRRTALKTKKCSLLFCRAKKPIPSLMRSGKSLSGMGSSRAQPERRDESGRASKNTLSDAYNREGIT